MLHYIDMNINTSKQEIKVEAVKNKEDDYDSLSGSSINSPENPKSINSKNDKRQDVLFKNIFRAVKKYYSNLFKDYSSFFEIKSKKERRICAMNMIQKFINEVLFKKQDSCLLKEIPYENLCDLIARIIIPEYFGKTNLAYDCRKYIDAFYKCIYKFNFKNAGKLYSSKSMKNIFEFLLASNDFEKMLIEDSNLNKNSKLCKEKSIEVMDGFAKNTEKNL